MNRRIRRLTSFAVTVTVLGLATAGCSYASKKEVTDLKAEVDRMKSSATITKTEGSCNDVPTGADWFAVKDAGVGGAENLGRLGHGLCSAGQELRGFWMGVNNPLEEVRWRCCSVTTKVAF